MKFSKYLIAAAFTTVCAVSAFAQSVTVTDAWARATVQGQKATGAFMKITAKDNTKLVGVSSPMAGVAEIHEMKMEKDVMKMAALSNGLDLPAGKAIELKPGSYHVMLMDLKAPLAKDTTVPLTLTLQDAKGMKSTVELKLLVGMQPPAMPSHDHGMHNHSEHNHGDHKH
ncbi:copper chaperone PCu(A)C [Limnohabitans sp.]|jgi:copper(I)-binding protein|uniref:copper chaperone PCu(A)C n=1 Tax=Limnohabitans sp. TaxID=1907725 RepID=UPI00286F12A5|nr:copper chaperone PCu(A)C [Limnohabitans sp.]